MSKLKAPEIAQKKDKRFYTCLTFGMHPDWALISALAFYIFSK
jgi:hypothetical protein